MELEESYRLCLKTAKNHYENFPVASILIPADYRQHIAAIYAFARTADDFADEEQDKIKLLDWRKQLQNCVKGEYEHPIFQALFHTIKTFQLPPQWLDDLLTAFLWDLEKNRFGTFAELNQYCRYSANPVGRIILWIFGFRSDKAIKYSDYITTALQLTNFWQDISIDLKKDRIYIPIEFLNRYQIKEEQILQRRYSANFGLMITDLNNRTKLLFKKGAGLFHLINGRLRLELILTVNGGMKILEKVLDQNDRILNNRPALCKWDWAKILFRSILFSF